MSENYIHLMMELMVIKQRLEVAQKERTQAIYALALSQQREAELRRELDNIYEDCGPR